MVLDDSPPSDDRDRYASPPDGTTQYSIDTSSFPRPIPIFGPLFGFNDALSTRVLTGKITTFQTALKRSVTEEEAQALAYWTYKQVAIYSYGTPLGIAGGLYGAYRTSATFRFPFYQPNLENLKPDVFPSTKWPILRGNRAVFMWHGLRTLGYAAVGNYVGRVIFGGYSSSTAAVGELGDPRLKVFRETLNREVAKDRLAKLPGGAPRPTEQGRAQQGDAAVPIGSQPQDDASPTGGNYGDELAEYGDSVNGPMRDEDLWQEKRRKQLQQQQQQSSAPLPPQGEPPEQSFVDFDDASPTGGLGMSKDTPQQQGPQQGGSAWDRVRNNAKSGGDKQPSAWSKVKDPEREAEQSAWWKYQTSGQESMEGSAETGSFSKSEEERSYAKQQAQKEFDAQVDRERRGGDFNNPSGNNRQL